MGQFIGGLLNLLGIGSNTDTGSTLVQIGEDGNIVNLNTGLGGTQLSIGNDGSILDLDTNLDGTNLSVGDGASIVDLDTSLDGTKLSVGGSTDILNLDTSLDGTQISILNPGGIDASSRDAQAGILDFINLGVDPETGHTLALIILDNFIESDVSSAEVFLEDFDGFIDRINTEPELL